MAGPAIYDAAMVYSTGLPVSNAVAKKTTINTKKCKCCLKDGILTQLRILDEQDAVNRYKWYNLPSGITGQFLERLLWYKGQVALFYIKALDKFFILPYALNGNIDCYGRYTGITPLQLGASNDADGKQIKEFIKGLKRYPVYAIDDLYDRNGNLVRPVEDCAVIIRDYTEQLGQKSIPRQQLNEPILDAMAECLPFARTTLAAGSGVKGLRVQDESTATAVTEMNTQITQAALNGDMFIPVVGASEFQDLTNGGALSAEQPLIIMQALDNYRLSLYGLKNGGIFQKKAHMLEAEQEMNNGNVGIIYQDGLTIRQHFCDLVNYIFFEQLGGNLVWCEPSETVIGVDVNRNGIIADEQEQTGIPGEQPEINEMDESEES